MPFTLATPYQLTEEIKKSRFLIQAAPITCVEQANQFIEQVSDTAATHNCWAWKLDQQYRFSDDGEPAGTAGRPILSAIENQQCDQVVVVVTRWFGGIKLGTGGLARAYGGGAARCLQQATLIELINRVHCYFQCYYSEWPLINNRVNELACTIEQQQFNAEGVEVTLAIPELNLTTLQQSITNLTKGRVLPKVIDTIKT